MRVRETSASPQPVLLEQPDDTNTAGITIRAVIAARNEYFFTIICFLVKEVNAVDFILSETSNAVEICGTGIAVHHMGILRDMV